MRIKSAKDLLDFLSELSAKGVDLDMPVLFDTEARTFNYHMAKIGDAYQESEFFSGYPYISLHEDRADG